MIIRRPARPSEDAAPRATVARSWNCGAPYTLTVLMSVLLCSAIGCQTSWWRPQAEIRDPVLSMNLTCEQVVDHLNSQHQGLEGWRSSSTVMWVRLPRGVIQRLEGSIACRSPQYFRLTAENLVSEADLGSNASRCWVYVRPGPAEIATWKHEDTALLQQVPTGLPYIDPSWLMTVLGVKPLDASKFELVQGPAGKHELWLQAVEDSPSGRPLRRVVKVDTINGIIRDHSVYDSELNLLVRAQLSQHKTHNGHRIPTKVKLEFPQVKSEISLTFRTIETNPHLPDELWKLPNTGMQVVDIGDMIRQQVIRRNPGQAPRARLQAPQFEPPIRSAFEPADGVYDGDPAPAEMDEPDWDTPVSFSRTTDAETESAPAEKSFMRRLWPF